MFDVRPRIPSAPVDEFMQVRGQVVFLPESTPGTTRSHTPLWFLTFVATSMWALLGPHWPPINREHTGQGWADSLFSFLPQSRRRALLGPQIYAFFVATTFNRGCPTTMKALPPFLPRPPQPPPACSYECMQQALERR